MGDAECFINTSYFWHDTEVQIKITGDFYSKLKSICDGSDPRQNQVSLKRLLTQKAFNHLSSNCMVEGFYYFTR